MKTCLLGFCVLFFAPLSCKKAQQEKPSEPAFIQFDPGGLSYLPFKINDYFIYRDSASGILDSVVVTESKIDKDVVPADIYQSPFGPVNYPAYYYQELSLSFTRFEGMSQQLWFHATAKSNRFIMGPVTANSDSAFLSLSEEDTTFQGECFGYPVTPYYSPQNSVDTFSSFIIEGNSYSNVIFYSNSNTLDTPAQDFVRVTYFWAKGVGIIKRQIKTRSVQETLTLVRHG